MKKIILCLTLAGTVAIHAQNITWNSPQVISGASDVSTFGLYFGSWAPGSASAYAVNGVTFQNNSDLSGLSHDFANTFNGYGSPGTANANYNTLLGTGAYTDVSAGGSSEFSWGGMTPGDTYQVELWVEDSRGNGSGARWENFSGGSLGNATYSTTSPNTSSAVGYVYPLFGPSSAGSPGYYITGTFTADSAGSEEILLTAFDNGTGNTASTQLNLVQVRDVTVTPEPSIPGLLTVGGAFTMIIIFRRRGKQTFA